jgi:hypothetical protein
MNLSAHIDELRRLMLEAREIATIHDYFDDHCVPSDVFMASGIRAKHEILISMVHLALKLGQANSPQSSSMLIHLPEYNLWHGPIPTQDGLAVVLYFDDINRGSCASCPFNTDMVHYFRFSIPEGLTEPIDASGVKLAHFSRRDRSDGN